ncbi:uncharacterized protein METZ01_LOCUS299750, partial [marine metagenome]
VNDTLLLNVVLEYGKDVQYLRQFPFFYSSCSHESWIVGTVL